MQEFEKLTDEMIRKAQQNIGREVTQGNQWVKVASAEAIKHAAWGIGDDNPLFNDEEYGQATRWGTIIAPPSFIEAGWFSYVYPRPKNRTEAEKTSRGVGLPGIGVLYTGCQNQYFAPVKAGMQVRTMMKYVGVVDSAGRIDGDMITPDADLNSAFEATASATAVDGRMIDHIRELRMFDVQSGKLLTRQIHHGVRFERLNGPGEGKYRDYQPPHYTDSEIKQICQSYESETRRGSRTLFWEDVNEGEELGPVVRGPLTVSGMVALQMGYGTLFCLSERDWYRFLGRFPAAGLKHPVTNVPTDPETIHFEQHGAATYGYPAPYFLGQQGIYWPSIMVTDWMGDDAFMTDLNMWNYRSIFLYEMIKMHGRVTRKEKTKDGSVAHLELWSEMTDGELQAKGTATVALPSRKEWSKYF